MYMYVYVYVYVYVYIYIYIYVVTSRLQLKYFKSTDIFCLQCADTNKKVVFVGYLQIGG